jgi:hypothetical protein
MSTTTLGVVVQMIFLALVAQAALDRYGVPPADVLARVHWPTAALAATTLASAVVVGRTLFTSLLVLAAACVLSASVLLSVAYVFSADSVRAIMSEALTQAIKRVL